MSMKELYNHSNRTGYSKINWCTNLDVINARRKVFDELKTVEEKPNPNRRCASYPLRTFEYKDFRFVETLSTRAGDRGDIYYAPTGELVATDADFYNFNTFVCWFYNFR